MEIWILLSPAHLLTRSWGKLKENTDQLVLEFCIVLLSLAARELMLEFCIMRLSSAARELVFDQDAAPRDFHTGKLPSQGLISWILTFMVLSSGAAEMPTWRMLIFAELPSWTALLLPSWSTALSFATAELDCFALPLPSWTTLVLPSWTALSFAAAELGCHAAAELEHCFELCNCELDCFGAADLGCHVAAELEHCFELCHCELDCFVELETASSLPS
ncbi:hypothetical protein SLEP1_g154 [Rubroshorea leprosula]|uniref:Uncharacterized protein n=2 Tax=Rubroshorea leprosula TaxID=152421 RepID=A0AAV5HKJ5_9ROSI|nr:hypothetical protein SLEP1_g154 [Rubroshorea leprosula]